MSKPHIKEQCKLLCLTHQRRCVAEEHHANACLCANAVHTPEVHRRKLSLSDMDKAAGRESQEVQAQGSIWWEGKTPLTDWRTPFNSNMDAIDAALGPLAGAAFKAKKEGLLSFVEEALNTGDMDAIDAALGPLAGASLKAKKEGLLSFIEEALSILKRAL